MKYCAVFGCLSYESVRGERKFFRFPNARSNGQLQRSLLWKRFCQDPSVSSLSKHFICDLHFQQSDFKDSNNLINTAVPSINGPKVNPKLRKTKKCSKESVQNCETREDTLSQHSHQSYFNEHSYSVDHPNKTNNPETDFNSSYCEYEDASTNLVTSQQENFNLSDSSIENSREELHSKKRKYFQESCNCSFKSYKTIQGNIEVKLHPHGGCEESEVKFNSHKSNKLFQNSQRQNLAAKSTVLNDLDIKVTSTIHFESDEDEEETALPNSQLIFSNSSSSESPKITSVFSNAKHTFIQHTDKSQHLPAENPVKTPPSLPTQLEKFIQDNLSSTEIKEEPKSYIGKLFKKHSTCRPLHTNDSKYSIAAIAESLGTFDSYIETPLERVDLNADDWDKLYTTSEITFPKLSEAQIGPMVNELRCRMASLSDRDKLDVSFLLSLMSVYPKAPKHIKELLFQRLCLLYVAVMFKWDTALALGSRSEKPTSSSQMCTASLDKNNEAAFEHNATSTEHGSCVLQTTDELQSKVPKQYTKTRTIPQIAFEVVVQERVPTIKEDEKNKVKTL